MTLEARDELIVAAERGVHRDKRLRLVDEQPCPGRSCRRPGGQDCVGVPQVGQEETTEEQVRLDGERCAGHVMDLELQLRTAPASRLGDEALRGVESDGAERT